MQIVICDLCGEDYTASDEVGGILFGSNSICPKCAPQILKSAEEYNELDHVKAIAQPGETFREFVIRIRQSLVPITHESELINDAPVHIGWYILTEDRKVTPVNDVIVWDRFLRDGDRTVAKTPIGEATVSTVFLGLDHNYKRNGPPILWETMVFGGPEDGQQARCSGSWEDAQRMHNNMVDYLKGLEHD